MATTVNYELYGEEVAISGRTTIRFYCCNELTILRRLDIYCNDDRDENWNPEYDSLPDYRWTIANTANFASDETTEDYRNYDYVSFTGSGFKPLVSLPHLSARPGQIMQITVEAMSWSSLSIQDMSDSEKVAPGIVYSNEYGHGIDWTGNTLSIRATFDIYELLDDEILNFNKWNGYPTNARHIPYQKGAWRITNANDGFPYVALPTETKIWTLNEYLRENNQNIPLQRFLKETVNGQTVYTPLQPHYKEIIG